MEVLRQLDSDTKIVVLDEHKLGYIPIPKAGCSTIKFEFSKVMGMEIAKHMVHKEVPKRKMLAKSDYEDYFIFTFVRNPFSRVLSAYKSKILGSKDINNSQVTNGAHRILNVFYGDEFYGGMTFEEYVMKLAKIPQEYMEEHFRPQHFTLFDNHGKPFYDFCGKLETINQDFDRLKKLVHIPFEDLPHFGNQSIHKHYSRYYNERMVKIIEKKYAKDLALFDYRYENVFPKVFQDPLVRAFDFDLVRNGKEAYIHFEIFDDYEYPDEGWFFVQLVRKDDDKQIDRIITNWRVVRGTAKRSKRGIEFNTASFPIDDYSMARIGHKTKHSKLDLWSRMLTF